MTSSNWIIIRVTGEFPLQRPVTWSFDFSLICAWINGWLNNREGGDLRRHHAHYDVIVMNRGLFGAKPPFPPIPALGTNFSETWIKLRRFSLRKIHLKRSTKRRRFYLGLNVFIANMYVKLPHASIERILCSKLYWYQAAVVLSRPDKFNANKISGPATLVNVSHVSTHGIARGSWPVTKIARNSPVPLKYPQNICYKL